MLLGIEGLYKISIENVSGINYSDGINLDATLSSKLGSQFNDEQ
jgi:hypothetical protein